MPTKKVSPEFDRMLRSLEVGEPGYATRIGREASTWKYQGVNTAKLIARRVAADFAQRVPQSADPGSPEYTASSNLASDRPSRRATGRLVCLAFKPFRAHSLVGFADFWSPKMRLKFFGCTVHCKGQSRWVDLPARPQLDRQHKLVTKENGKPACGSRRTCLFARGLLGNREIRRWRLPG